MKYSDKRQEAVLRKLMPPNNKTVAEVSVEESISEVTIYKWRSKPERRANCCLTTALIPLAGVHATNSMQCLKVQP